MSEQWATVELMGHGQSAGKITFEGGLVRVDVPEGDGFRTEYYGMAAIFSVKLVSEEIARAFVKPLVDAYEYNAPIVTREMHEKAVRSLEARLHGALNEVEELRRRLTSVNALPEPKFYTDEDKRDEDRVSGKDIPF